MTFFEYASILDVSGTSNLAFISAYRQKNPARLNVLRDRELAKDITEAGYKYLHARGQAIETKSNGDKAVVKEKSFLVVAGAATEEGFKDYVVHWLNKYEQEYALVKFRNSDVAWKVYPTGNQFKFGSWEKDVANKYR